MSRFRMTVRAGLLLGVLLVAVAGCTRDDGPGIMTFKVAGDTGTMIGIEPAKLWRIMAERHRIPSGEEAALYLQVQSWPADVDNTIYDRRVWETGSDVRRLHGSTERLEFLIDRAHYCRLVCLWMQGGEWREQVIIRKIGAGGIVEK